MVLTSSTSLVFSVTQGPRAFCKENRKLQQLLCGVWMQVFLVVLETILFYSGLLKTRPPVFQTGAYTPGDRGTVRFVVMAISKCQQYSFSCLPVIKLFIVNLVTLLSTSN